MRTRKLPKNLRRRYSPGGFASAGQTGLPEVTPLYDIPTVEKNSAERAGNVLKSAGKGAALGASIGSVIPGIGTAIGGVVGGLGGLAVGLFSNKKKEKQRKKENAEIEKLNADRRAANTELLNQRGAMEATANLNEAKQQGYNTMGNVGQDFYGKYGGIHINPANKGKFTATKKKTGKSTEELTHSKNPLTRKRAIFAQNARKWKHEFGGISHMYAEGGLDYKGLPLKANPFKFAGGGISGGRLTHTTTNEERVRPNDRLRFPGGGETKKTAKEMAEESRKARAERFKNTPANIDEKLREEQVQAEKNEYGLPAGDQQSKYGKKIHMPKYRSHLDKFAKGGSVGYNQSEESIAAAHKRAGGSNVGKYNPNQTFAGPSGGAPRGSYPIGDIGHAKSALKLAHHAPNPEGIKAAVYRKYPELKHEAGGFSYKFSHGGLNSYEQNLADLHLIKGAPFSHKFAQGGLNSYEQNQADLHKVKGDPFNPGFHDPRASYFDSTVHLTNKGYKMPFPGGGTTPKPEAGTTAKKPVTTTQAPAKAPTTTGKPAPKPIVIQGFTFSQPEVDYLNQFPSNSEHYKQAFHELTQYTPKKATSPTMAQQEENRRQAAMAESRRSYTSERARTAPNTKSAYDAFLLQKEMEAKDANKKQTKYVETQQDIEQKRAGIYQQRQQQTAAKNVAESTPAELKEVAKKNLGQTEKANEEAVEYEYEKLPVQKRFGGPIYKKGGRLDRLNSDTTKAVGNTHEEGGIDLSRNAEIENREVVTDKGNSYFITSAKLKNPLTGNTFAKDDERISKKIGKLEGATDNKENRNALRLLNMKKEHIHNMQQMMNGNYGEQGEGQHPEPHAEGQFKYGGGTDYAYKGSLAENAFYENSPQVELASKKYNFGGSDPSWKKRQSGNRPYYYTPEGGAPNMAYGGKASYAFGGLGGALSGLASKFQGANLGGILNTVSQGMQNIGQNMMNRRQPQNRNMMGQGQAIGQVQPTIATQPTALAYGGQVSHNTSSYERVYPGYSRPTAHYNVPPTYMFGGRTKYQGGGLDDMGMGPSLDLGGYKGGVDLSTGMGKTLESTGTIKPSFTGGGGGGGFLSGVNWGSVAGKALNTAGDIATSLGEYANQKKAIKRLERLDIPQPILQQYANLGKMNLGVDKANVDKEIAASNIALQRGLTDENVKAGLRAQNLASNLEAKAAINQKERNLNQEIANRQQEVNLGIRGQNNAALMARNQAQFEKQAQLIGMKSEAFSKLMENLGTAKNTGEARRFAQNQMALDAYRLSPEQRAGYSDYMKSQGASLYGKPFRRGGRFIKMYR